MGGGGPVSGILWFLFFLTAIFILVIVGGIFWAIRSGLGMKNYLSFQQFPLVLVIAMVLWAWLSLFSVLVGSLF
jgi:hypothetical protein